MSTQTAERFEVKAGLDKIKGFDVVGVTTRVIDRDTASEQINALWEQFFKESIGQKIENREDDIIYAVYSDYEGDHTQPYTLVIGCPVSAVEKIPEGMVVKTIPKGSYAAYEAAGEFPKKVIETWGAIWQSDLKRTYTGDYELYGKKFTSQSPQAVDVLIAIE